MDAVLRCCSVAAWQTTAATFGACIVEMLPARNLHCRNAIRQEFRKSEPRACIAPYRHSPMLYSRS
tara:strand:+ start:246 stop:443 length:198 start_codon:yes stop_codon:yes gene_type:complete